jgi:penicillin-binding protein 1A
VLPAPSDYDPVGHLDVARGREQHVLDRLVTVGTLSRQEAQAAFDGPLGIRPALG